MFYDVENLDVIENGIFSVCAGFFQVDLGRLGVQRALFVDLLKELSLPTFRHRHTDFPNIMCTCCCAPRRDSCWGFSLRGVLKLYFYLLENIDVCVSGEESVCSSAMEI